MSKRIFFVIISLILASIIVCTLGIGYMQKWDVEYMAVTASIIAAMATVIYSAFVYLQIESSNRTLEIMSNQLSREARPILINTLGDLTARIKPDQKLSIYHEIKSSGDLYRLLIQIYVLNAGRSEALNVITLTNVDIKQVSPTIEEMDVKFMINDDGIKSAERFDNLFDYEELMLKDQTDRKFIELDISKLYEDCYGLKNGLENNECLYNEYVINFRITQYYKNIIDQWYKTTFTFHHNFRLKDMSANFEDDCMRVDNPINNTTISNLDEVINCLESESNDPQNGEKAKTILMSLKYNSCADRQSMNLKE